jgi:hypothetical protein
MKDTYRYYILAYEDATSGPSNMSTGTTVLSRSRQQGPLVLAPVHEKVNFRTFGVAGGGRLRTPATRTTRSFIPDCIALLRSLAQPPWSLLPSSGDS